MQSASAVVPRTVGRYVIYGEIAAGGMATVHFGRIVGAGGFSRPVAIKRLHAHFARDQEFVAMFLDEARLASRIFHPNVVAPLDVVQTDDHELLLVMEYVRGVSLSKLIRATSAENKQLPPRVVMSIISNLLHGLHAAHEAKNDAGQPLNIVHRDVSPQNVIVGTDGVSRVLDFGVAKAAGRMQSTRDGQLKGKIAYMSPEQVRAEDVTRQTDIYAASVVLWEALTGRRLFKAESDVGTITRVLAGKIELPSSLVPTLPAALDAVVMKGLKPDAADRYATAREMANELELVMGLAPAVEVGELVEAVAADELNERAARIAEIEGSGSQSSWSAKAMKLPVGVPAGTPSHELPTRADALAPPKEKSPTLPTIASPVTTAQSLPIVPVTAGPTTVSLRLVLALAGGALLIALLIAIAVFARSGHDQPAATQSSASTSAPSAVVVPAPITTVTPSATIAATSVSVDSLPKTPSTTRPPATAVVVKPPPTATANTKADCNPPYTTDSKGHTHFKPQCM